MILETKLWQMNGIAEYKERLNNLVDETNDHRKRGATMKNKRHTETPEDHLNLNELLEKQKGKVSKFESIKEQPMNIIVVVSKPNDYRKDGIRLMTPEQVLGGECDGMKIDDYLLSSEVMHGDNITSLGKLDEYLSNAMMTSNRRL